MLLQTIYFNPEIKENITHLILFGSICNINRITKDKIKKMLLNIQLATRMLSLVAALPATPTLLPP